MTILKLLGKADAFTLANAALGFLAITYISDGKYQLAEALILLAVIADGLDGIVARRFGGNKPSMGDYLDIMADYLSFCVAPAILFYQLYFNVAASPFSTPPQDLLVGAAAGVFMLLGLLRLARHVAKAGPEAGRFQGLPTTGAGFFATALIAVGGLGDVLTSLLILGVGWLMVSEAAYPKVRGNMAYASGALVLACAAVLLLVWTPSTPARAVLLAGLAGASLYAVSGIAFAMMRVPIGGLASATPTPGRPLPRPPLARGEITEEFAAEGDDEGDELQALYQRMLAQGPAAELAAVAVADGAAKPHEIAKVEAEQQRRKAEMLALTRRLAEREKRMKDLKQRLGAEASAAGGEAGRASADRLREIDRREMELKRREDDLLRRESQWAATREEDATKSSSTKTARRATDSQEVDPDA